MAVPAADRGGARPGAGHARLRAGGDRRRGAGRRGGGAAAGACAFAARGPARYFGGEEAAAERIVEQVANECGVESQVGVADGVFAAGLAARAGRVIAPGETAEFLAGRPVDLERPELADLLRRLGVHTLGDFAALPPGDVLARFGFDAALAQRLAGGNDDRPLAVRQPPPDLDVSETFEEPVERVDMAAFAGRALAERLHERLAAHGLACTRLASRRSPPTGRNWKGCGVTMAVLTAPAIADRVRWQLDGWLTGARHGAPDRPPPGWSGCGWCPMVCSSSLDCSPASGVTRAPNANARTGRSPRAGAARPGRGGHAGDRRGPVGQ